MIVRLAVLAASLLAAAPADPPSFVFILADDLRWNALGCMGDRIIQTPHLDRLAREGVLFRNAFVTTSICAVSRASILLGQHARRHGIHDFATPFSAAQWDASYAGILRKAGYRTGFIGKFGVGRDVSPMAAHFDYWKGLPGQAGPFFDPNDASRTHATARFGDQALDFLRGADDKPFCLSISFSAPHARDGQPREYPPDPRDETLYADAAIPVPKLATEQAYRRLPEIAQKSEGRRRWERRFATPEMVQRILKDYYRLITGVDREVGRILDELAARKLGGNTVVLFTSDNGYFFGERGMADKWLPYEESIRVPMIAFDPRRPAPARGRAVDAMALNIDVAPTILELASRKAPATMQGRSLVPFLGGAAPSAWRGDFFYEHLTGPNIIPQTEAVRTDRWKYFRWLQTKPVLEELYDLREDPLEERNLSADPAHAETLAALRARWEKLREELK